MFDADLSRVGFALPVPSLTKRTAGLAVAGAGLAVFVWRTHKGGRPSVVLPAGLMAAGVTLALTSQPGELLSPPPTSTPSTTPIPAVGAAAECAGSASVCRQRFLAQQSSSWVMPAWGVGALMAGTAGLIVWRMLT